MARLLDGALVPLFLKKFLKNLKLFKDTDAATEPGKLFHGLTTLLVKKLKR
jgi:hypothetical protein